MIVAGQYYITDIYGWHPNNNAKRLGKKLIELMKKFPTSEITIDVKNVPVEALISQLIYFLIQWFDINYPSYLHKIYSLKWITDYDFQEENLTHWCMTMRPTKDINNNIKFKNILE